MHAAALDRCDTYPASRSTHWTDPGAGRPGVGGGALGVPPPGPGSCRICAGRAASGYSICISCRTVAMALGRPPVEVTPICLVTASSPAYRALREYKSAPHEVARHQASRLAEFVSTFAARHLECAVPGGADVTVVVPSGRGGRPPPHPLTRVAAAASRLPPVVSALRAGPDTPGHRRPSSDAYHASRELSGARVLLFDDVYTTGAHLQSAAAALLEAGASSVHGLVVARYEARPYDARGCRAPAGMAGAADPQPWRPDCCMRCPLDPG